MIYILVYTWLRVSELCDIKVADVGEELQSALTKLSNFWVSFSVRASIFLSGSFINFYSNKRCYYN